MTPTQKSKAIIIATSTTIGFIGDVTMYSIAASKGKKFSLHLPKGKELLQVVLIGAITGVIIDLVMNKIMQSVAPVEEKELDKLVKAEKQKIYTGKIRNQSPQQIIWI